MFNHNPFSSEKEQRQQPTWDPNTLAMTQPSTPAAPTQLVSQQLVYLIHTPLSINTV
ncbi:uncharacterized protein P174DRAFT_437195 [Aspergillus novofumigatus IBT 16806]|uniref:Uncharacterized protein n=1 Tax=Aspergillus novofumigatus (strain IBT 16806) TaxID=1392255 RepID=A0A2I1CMC6_ASPN1|nr:uncharacterized protein P174DRAFT_437195 [Aspergillus novofumigatus IBT 16806]PKX98772.1 hypothetical protein P174DRAFT_437195 [Aspergillus novofumigatus IBT 16806]